MMRLFLWFLSPVFLLLAALPAGARPRDDALAGAFRCAVIGEARQWLDCYYGAAQPVRAGLGLAPAMAAQVKLASAPPAGGAPVLVAVRDEVMARAAGCMRVAAERAWLDCYYESAVPMRAQLGLVVPAQAARPVAPPPAQFASALPPPSPTRAAPSGPPPMPRNTGLFNGMFNNIKPVVRNTPMQSYSFNKGGAFTVTLADGQVWVQSDEDQVYHPARWRRPASEMLVTIAPNAMHTFNLTVDGETRFYKVRRVR
ncbi:MAG TPA: hypothetical protein VLL04_08980 [Rhizomicrobium sp.]|nr:hypothetical protein [Rhizomicrobium sp.]